MPKIIKLKQKKTEPSLQISQDQIEILDEPISDSTQNLDHSEEKSANLLKNKHGTIF